MVPVGLTAISALNYRTFGCQQRAWVPESVWPCGMQELEPYRSSAYRLLDMIDWAAPAHPKDDHATVWKNVPVTYPPIRFGQKYREDASMALRLAERLKSGPTL